MKPIFHYINYRVFLADYYNYMKATHGYFSYRWFANKAGLSSPGLYQRLLKGERNLTPNTLSQYLLALNLSSKESNYFRILVAFNQASSSDEKQRNYTLLLSMAEFVKEHTLESNEYSFIKHWYIPVVREIVTFFDFKGDFTKLASCTVPPIKPKEAKQAIQILTELEFIEKSPTGLYTQKDTTLTSGDDFAQMLGLARRSFNRQMIQLAEKSLETFAVDERFAMGVTLGVSQTSYDALLQEFNTFRERVAAIAEKEKDVERVCQLNFQLFPVSKNLSTSKQDQK